MLDLGREPTAQAAFKSEAEMLWRLRHRNIVGLTSFLVDGEGRGILLMVSEGILRSMGGICF